MRSHFILIAFFFSLFNSIFSQSLDTVSIHRPLVFGIHYHKCMKLWFGNPRSCSIITSQDRLLTNDSIYYFKVYGYTKKLILEGKKEADGALSGEIKFYYKSGKIKQTRLYRNFNEGEDDSIAPIACDGGSPWGTWKCYDRKGRIIKTIRFSVEDAELEQPLYLETISTYSKKGVLKSEIKKVHHPCSK